MTVSFRGDGRAMSRLQPRDHPAYELAEQFADEWDEKAFDPDYKYEPLEHFAPVVRDVFSRKPRLPDHRVAAQQSVPAD